jgi:hypothetical protein
MIQTVAKKRGRRSKKEIEAQKLQTQQQCQMHESEEENVELTTLVEPVAPSTFSSNKKRGRKPKGGKIIQQNVQSVEEKEVKPNIILHLKCSLKDLQMTGDYNSNFTTANIDAFQFSGTKNELLTYEIISNPNILENGLDTTTYTDDIVDKSMDKEIWKKLKMLDHDLQLNSSDKKSACFWCTYDFDNPPIYIPKHFIKDSYHVYGCFCSPECATAYLMEENIDSSVRFERYYMLNNIYSKIYQHSKNIKPAPNPYYMLDKYCGNLTIQEYRNLLKSDKLFILVDKPLTRILPEYHEDNDEFIINNKIIPSNNFQLKKGSQKKMTKNNILNEKFGIVSVSN